MVRCVRVPRAAWPRPLVAPSHRNVDLLGAGHNTTYTALNYGLVQETGQGRAEEPIKYEHFLTSFSDI